MASRKEGRETSSFNASSRSGASFSPGLSTPSRMSFSMCSAIASPSLSGRIMRCSSSHILTVDGSRIQLQTLVLCIYLLTYVDNSDIQIKKGKKILPRGGNRVFQQLLTPVGDSLGLSFFVAILPIVAVLVLLGLLRRPAWQAALAGLVVGFGIAVTAWKMPVSLAVGSIANGAVFALWPVMWIVLNALLLYNIAVRSGRFDAFRDWVVDYLPNDRRVVLVVVGFCFGALLEGVSGFGTPVAITSALLILLGFQAREALTFTLIFNTAPVAFGALGAPITTLGAVTHLSDVTLGAMVGRQLPFIALLLPFYVIGIYGGRRSIATLWPVLLIAGGSFAAAQFVV